MPLVIDRQSWPNRENRPNRQVLPRPLMAVRRWQCWQLDAERLCPTLLKMPPLSPPPAFQFSLTHVMLLMAAIGVWLAAWRLHDPVLTFLIIAPSLALGPILIWQGRLRGNRELAAAGVVITYAAPAVVVLLIGINALVQLAR
jgi:hypothetical protein